MKGIYDRPEGPNILEGTAAAVRTAHWLISVYRHCLYLRPERAAYSSPTATPWVIYCPLYPAPYRGNIVCMVYVCRPCRAL